MAESELWDKPVAGSRLPLLFARRKKIETNFRSLWTGASLVETSPLSSSRRQTGIDWLIFLSMLMAWWDWSKALHHIFHYLIPWIEHSIHCQPILSSSFTGSWTSVTFELWSQPKSFLLCRFGDFFCEEMFFVVLRSIQYNHTYDFRHFRHKGLT